MCYTNSECGTPGKRFWDLGMLTSNYTMFVHILDAGMWMWETHNRVNAHIAKATCFVFCCSDGSRAVSNSYCPAACGKGAYTPSHII